MAQESLVLVGTYTRGSSKGIYAYGFDSATGKLSPKGLSAEANNASYLVVHPNGKWVYATSEISDYQKERSGALVAYSLDAASGKLTQLNHVSSRGSAPCHLSIDKTGKFLLAANYNGGNIAMAPILPDGKLGPVKMVMQHRGSSANASRQKEPHAHSVNVAANNKWAVAADLGTDELSVYRLDTKLGMLALDQAPLKLAAGLGPRHFAFHPKGKFAYAVNELGSSVTALTWDARTGTLKDIQTITTLPADFKGENYCAEVVVHPNGKFLYASNRGHHSIAVYEINQTTGQLTAKGQVPTGGQWPRNFNIDPTGRWLLAANERSDSLVTFTIDPSTGALKPTGDKQDVGAPVCVKFFRTKK